MLDLEEVERIIPIVCKVCEEMGCDVWKKGDKLSCDIGDDYLCYVTREESRDVETVRNIITNALISKNY